VWRELLSRIGITLLMIGIFRFIYIAGTEITSSQARIQRFTGFRMKYSLVRVIDLVVKAAIIILALLSIPQIWNINFTGLVAGLGLGGLALSLAAKDVLDDFIGFINIMADDPFIVNEYVVSPHAEGSIEHIGLRSTRIRQLDQALVMVPNSKLVNDPLTNWSRLQKRWFNFTVGVTYDATVEQLRALIDDVREMLKGRDPVDEESVVVLFSEFADSSLNILVRGYIQLAGWTPFKEEVQAINFELMRLVEKHGMSMAFPTQSIYLETPATLPEAVALQMQTDTPQPDYRHEGSPYQHEDDDPGVEEAD
jgi:MscS family membrane protein